MTRVKRIAFAAVAVALAVGPARAFHEDDLPLLTGETGQGNGWRSFTVTTNGSQYAVDITSALVRRPAQAGAFFYRGTDNAFQGGVALTAFPGKEGVLVRINLPDSDPVEVEERSDPAGGPLGLGFTFNDPQHPPPFVGTSKIVIWWAGDGASWDWAFRAAPGTTIDARDGGDRAYLVDSEDFASTTHAEAHTMAVGARASVQADYPLGVNDTLIGFYQLGLATVGTSSVTSPRGEQQCGLVPVAVPLVLGSVCVFADMVGAGRNGPGNYVFHTTSAGGGFAGAFDDAWFGGADARLP